MCDPTCEEEQGSCCGQVRWLGVSHAITKIHADMIERHKQDDQSAQEVNGGNPLAFHFIGLPAFVVNILRIGLSPAFE